MFSGTQGAPAQCFPAAASCGGPYTTVATSPVTREAPYLYVNAAGDYNVFVPATQRNTSGTTWSSGPTAGTSIPLDEFFVAKPTDDVQTINNALARGQNLLFTPGVYAVDQDDQGEARRHRRARARVRDARAAERRRRR